MSKLLKLISLWAPVLAWMSFIFYLSSRTRISVDEAYIVNFILFKTLHVVEYGILFFLLARAFFQNKSPKQYFFYAFLVAVLFAISDEIHQSFIPTREGKIRDVFIDTIGIVIMYMYIKKRPRILESL